MSHQCLNSFWTNFAEMTKLTTDEISQNVAVPERSSDYAQQRTSVSILGVLYTLLDRKNSSPIKILTQVNENWTKYFPLYKYTLQMICSVYLWWYVQYICDKTVVTSLLMLFGMIWYTFMALLWSVGYKSYKSAVSCCLNFLSVSWLR